MTRAAAFVDELAAGRVLVFGSLPPDARDLDVLVPAGLRVGLEERLRDAGFLQRDDEWARFAECTVEAVELASARNFRIDEAEVERLVADGIPLEGYEHLVRPAPGDDLLVLARMLQWGGWKEKRRARLERAAGGWDAAEGRARDWGVDAELAQLRAIAAAEAPAGRPARRRPSRPRVVALSGIDGSGKSTQARALQQTLEQLGYRTAVAWTPLSQNTWLAALAKPVKRVLRSLRRSTPPAEESEPSGLHRDEGTELRSSSAAVRFAWTTLVALANGTFHARSAFSADVVIFDRYLLDTAAQFRFRYGAERRYRLQNALVRLLSPRPVAAFFLDLPADVSLERKPDDRWTPDELRTQERLYREESVRLRVTRLDAVRPMEELCSEIAAAVWRSLG